ncbi:hypothetical protein OROHE_016741 [Orobanche hederae]
MVSNSRTIMISIVYLFFCLLVVVVIVLSSHIVLDSGDLMHFAREDGNITITVRPEDAYLHHRKLMLKGVCTKWDISISQSEYPSPGIPQFIVQIVNTRLFLLHHHRHYVHLQISISTVAGLPLKE